MSNYSLSVCLTDLQGAQVQANAQGKQFVFIPIEDADLFMSAQSGKVYLNLAMWAKRNGADQYGKTHGIKLSPSQEYRKRIGEEAVKNIPFIGHAKEIVPKNPQPQMQNQPVYQQTAPQGYAAPQYPQTQQSYAQPYSPNPSDDMPF